MLAPVLNPSTNEGMTADLLSWLASVADDPYAFTMGAYPWGEPGPLESFPGPDTWSIELMGMIKSGIVDWETAVQIATASGHGIGKSATVAWIIMWAFTTFPDTRGIVTANTEVQLRTKTWSELGKWFNLCFFARDHFILNATSLTSKDPTRERTWRIDMIAWSKTNPAAFAGLHNQGKRLLIIFDEASEIDDIIWETAEGALSDRATQIIWLVFGNPTRNIGRFRECFSGGQFSKLWQHKQIDSRTVAITNKKYINRQIEAYGGEDNDIIRIRWLGQFPLKGLMEFFSASAIDAAMSPDREVFVDAFTPLALGVDVARFGKNNTVLFPRKGRDARTLEPKIYSGLSTTEVANRIHDCFTTWRPDGIFIDGGGVGGGVVDQCRNQRLFVWEVQFGGKDDITGLTTDNQGERYANKRAAMYGALRSWLTGGTLPMSPELRTSMLAIKYTFNKKDEIQLVSKEDLLEDNPNLDLDTLDALCLTFGGPISRTDQHAGGDHPHKPLVETEYDPYSPERMAS